MRAIDADAMIDRLKEWDTEDKTDKALYNFTLNRINEQPTIQPKRGRWEQKDFRYHCSCCDGIVPKAILWDFCPNCGADMRGEQDDSV